MEPTTEFREERRNRRLWLSLLGSAAIWGVHLMIAYPITSMSCRWNLYLGEIGGLSGMKFIQLLATVIPAALVAGLAWLAYREWQVTKQEDTRQKPEEFEDRAERTPFLAYLALLLNALFFLTIVLGVVPILTLNECG